MTDGVNSAIPGDGGEEVAGPEAQAGAQPNAQSAPGQEPTPESPGSAAPFSASAAAATPPSPTAPVEPVAGASFGRPSDLIARIPRRSLIIAGGLLTVGAAGGIAAAVAGFGGSGSKQLPAARGASGAAQAEASASPSPTYPPAALTTVPANGASNVDPSKPVTVAVANGTITSVELSGGQTTTGTLSDDKTTWTSDGALQINTAYTLQVQAAGKDGKAVSASASFSTLKPTATLGVVEMWPGDGTSVGVGQPIRVQFSNYVPAAYRAEVEKACVVTTNPAVAGAWSWVQDDMMDWRLQNFWQTGTTVSVALNLAGVRAGEHQYGVKDHTLNFTIRGTDLRLIVDTKAFHATCYQNGQVIRTFPIDTGMNDPRFITWSGTMAVLGQGNPVEMKGDYGNGDKYDELVNWATQITYSGTYVHSAPWDGQIGYVNSSHGCIHCRPVDATWFYNQAHVGDVVQVTGTSKNVAVTNGFGDYGVAWSTWLAGSSYGATIGGKPANT
ncbi:MAG TPA: Ig-like domain-containing protein [Actinocrinis sp.]|jgi:lipoprotein-anchoring transpeptidase ErfK/SrfK|uniref:L,D-transpeptidase n=1 Tax=Actinocrinis sp. TaxID=1920516 RepID=UPI002DDD9A99|nr:Ig-like domain-containing protein [Actinocrinis sp.]HEV3171054.1 Ig-like domain-containing protein [Actinocrinis sp.]